MSDRHCSLGHAQDTEDNFAQNFEGTTSAIPPLGPSQQAGSCHYRRQSTDPEDKCVRPTRSTLELVAFELSACAFELLASELSAFALSAFELYDMGRDAFELSACGLSAFFKFVLLNSPCLTLRFRTLCFWTFCFWTFCFWSFCVLNFLRWTYCFWTCCVERFAF